MKKKTLLGILLILPFIVHCQIVYEQGYLIKNDGNRVDCLIKNIDWKNNPSTFLYKTSDDTDAISIGISDVKEFGVNGSSKYVRARVKIDRSSDRVEKLTHVKKPIFEEEELFLKILVDGKATLLLYEDGNLIRFFYSIDDSEISQLVYKRYIKDIDKVAINSYYKTQLYSFLRCNGISDKVYEQVGYRKKSLVAFFDKYNKCETPELSIKEEKPKQDLFNLTIRPGFNISNLNIKNNLHQHKTISFDSENNFRIGVETEFLLPFNKSKWSVIIEPTYQYYKSTKASYDNLIYPPKKVFDANVDYKSIDIPVGLRHYFFLSDQSKLYINAAYKLNFPINSSLTFTKDDGSKMYDELDFTMFRACFVFGCGYKFVDKLSIEMQYHTKNQVLDFYKYWYSDYNTISIVLGYTLF